MPEPLLLTRNYVDDESEITVSHGSVSKGYMFDRDPDSKWTTSGANDDATSVTAIIEFFEDGVAVERDIDRLLLINHNFKAWTLEYWDGAAWQPLTSETVDDEEITFKTFGQVSTTKVRLTVTETQVADQEKEVGEIIVCAILLDPARDPDNLDVTWREMSAEIMMGDGSLHKTVTRWAQNRVQRYECRVNFSFLDEDDRADLKAIRDAGEPFLWYPESVARPGEIYLVHWANPWTEKYVSSYKGAGSEVTMALKEV